jgi:hypothetical protein
MSAFFLNGIFNEEVIKMLLRAISITVVLLLTGCANPINQVTMEEYAEKCRGAEQAKNFPVAVEAYRRAWINTRIGNLGPEAESMALYNLGRVQKNALMLSEAEMSLKRSLELELPLSGPMSAKVGRRVAELSTVLLGLRRTSEGVVYMVQLKLVASQYQGAERRYVAGLFYVYADELRGAGSLEKADEFVNFAQGLGIKRSETPGG